ncbi:MAG: glycosyltransferase family 1 protein [Chloroflexi bacterium]|nr:glycosyltransferase family 1 protein [Chloroflexota bacterium]
MRIAIDARMAYYTQAGIGQYIHRLLDGLGRLKSDEEILLLQMRHDRPLHSSNNHFQRHSLWTPSHHRLENFSLPLELALLGLDVLHSPDFIPPFHRNFHSIITVHDLGFLLYPQFLTKESARYYSQIDQAVRSTDHIIAVSESTRQDLTRLLGVPEHKITVVHEAANEIFQPIENPALLEQVRRTYNIPGDFFIFISTLEPRKNLPTLLRSLRRLLDDYKAQVKLVVVGRRGWLFDEIFDTVETLHLKNDVLFLGRMPGDDLVALVNAATALVHPAYYEGFGLPPLEAMHCGTPVIVSNVASLPEVVGDAGLLVDPKDEEGWAVAMWRVLTDKDLRQQMREKGLVRAQTFSLEKMARETMAVYRRVSTRARGPSHL